MLALKAAPSLQVMLIGNELEPIFSFSARINAAIIRVRVGKQKKKPKHLAQAFAVHTTSSVMSHPPRVNTSDAAFHSIHKPARQKLV